MQNSKLTLNVDFVRGVCMCVVVIKKELFRCDYADIHCYDDEHLNISIITKKEVLTIKTYTKGDH